AGKAPGIITEVEIEEHHDGHDHAHDEACVAEVNDNIIDVVERHQVDHRVYARHAIDAIHEVEAVHSPNADDEHQDYKPQRMGVHPRMPHDHGETGDLGSEAEKRMLTFYVVSKTGGSDERSPYDKPWE